jgi:hypothetical protein
MKGMLLREEIGSGSIWCDMSLSRTMRILGLCVVLLGATVAYAQQSSAPIATPSGVQSAAQVGQAAPPRCDANCVRANAAKASEACAPGIEAQAPSDFDWIARPNPGIFQQPILRHRPTRSCASGAIQFAS